MYTFLRFPNFKKKALTLSYDDGVVYDERLVEILDKNGIKATFNIDSGIFGLERRMNKEDAVKLFKNSPHEVAVHGEQHFALTEVNPVLATKEILFDRMALEQIFGGIIRGMAYAFGSFSDGVAEILRTSGIVYSRTTTSTESFSIPENFLYWHPTAHHKNPALMELLDKFLDTSPARHYFCDHPRLFYLWGHSYEFEDDGNWEIIEEFAKKAGGHENVWYATNIEIYDYVTAYNRLVYSVDGSAIHNPSAIDVYIHYFGENVLVPAGKSVMGLKQNRPVINRNIK